MKKSHGRARRGFSLIEMLVVMAVILTLLGIILPSLNGVRDKAYAAVCANNERQLGIALTNYLNDNNGYFPFSGGCWHATGAERDSFVAWGACGGAGGHFDKTSGIFPYISSKDILICPVDSTCAGSAYRGTATAGLSYNMTDPTMYWYNTANSTANNIGVNRKDVINGQLSYYVMMLEQDCTANGSSHLDARYMMNGVNLIGNGVGDFSKRHSGKSAVLYIDGHVEFHSWSPGSSTTTCTCCTGAVCSGGAPSCPGAACSPSCCTTSSSGGGGGDFDPLGYCGTGTTAAAIGSGDPRCPLLLTGKWAH